MLSLAARISRIRKADGAIPSVSQGTEKQPNNTSDLFRGVACGKLSPRTKFGNEFFLALARRFSSWGAQNHGTMPEVAGDGGCGLRAAVGVRLYASWVARLDLC